MYFTDNIEYLQANWKPLETPFGREFSNTYRLVHQAVQFLAITGKSLYPPRYDDSHTTFLWDYAGNCFAGDWIHGKRTVQLKLHPETLEMQLIPYGEPAAGTFSLLGKTKKEIYSLLRQLLVTGGVQVDHFITDMHYDLPAHEVCNGGRYRIDYPGLHTELIQHYSNAFLVLHLLNGKAPSSSGIRCWPHHFDLSITLNVARNSEPEPVRLEVGFSPANPDAQEPHFFVRLAGMEEKIIDCRKLKYGHWYPPPRTGTFLVLSKLLAKKGAARQVDVLATYLRESFDLFR